MHASVLARPLGDREGVRASTPLTQTPLVTFVVVRRHRGTDILRNCVDRLARCGVRRSETEVILVDRTEGDPAERRLARQFALIDLMVQADDPRVSSLRQAVSMARGRYVFLLQDDCCPQPGSLSRMIGHFESDPNLAAAVFTVEQSDGTICEPAFPNVIQRTGTGIRRRLLEHVPIIEDSIDLIGDFQLSLRLLANGYDIRLFDDLHVLRETPEGDDIQEDFSTQVRDAILLATRLFPYRLMIPYATDWMTRFRYVAMEYGCQWGFLKGVVAGLAGSMRRLHRRPMDPHAFDTLLQMSQIEKRLIEMKRVYGLKKIVLLNLSANVRAFQQAARNCGIRIMAIADPDFAGPDRAYRGIPIVADHAAAAYEFDAALVSTLVSADAARRSRHWSAVDARPVIDLMAQSNAFIFAAAPESAPLRIAARSA